LAILATAAGAWLSNLGGGAPCIARRSHAAPTRSVALPAAAIFFGAWVPVLAIAQYSHPDSRLFYAPMVGLAILIGRFAEAVGGPGGAIGRLGSLAAPVHAFSRSLLIAFFLACAVM